MDRSGRLYSSIEEEVGDGLNDIGDYQLGASPELSSYLETSAAARHESLLRELARAAGSDHDFEDVLHACHYYDIPSALIEAIGVREKGADQIERVSIGKGLTSHVIMHELNKSRSRHMPSNERVALKLFTSESRASEADPRTLRQRVYKSILKEITTLSHKLLRDHANIAQLLFVGWAPEQQYPCLAMELGQHGSLEYILCDPASALSPLQKAHITIDVALALQVLHEAGFVHGDIKPDNILIFSHPEPKRQLVAKLADFGGSFSLLHHPTDKPTHITHLWCAPEVGNFTPEIEWKRADVYSYGLVAASVWAERRRGGPMISSILAESLPTDLDDHNAAAYLRHLKIQAGELTGIVSTLERKLGSSLPAGMELETVFQAIKQTLEPMPNRRPTSEELLKILGPLAASLERSVDENHYLAHTRGQSSQYRPYDDIYRYDPQDWRLFEIGGESIVYGYKEQIVERAQLAIRDIENEDQFKLDSTDLPAELPDDISVEDFLDMLARATQLDNIRATVPQLLGLMKRGRYKYYLGISSGYHRQGSIRQEDGITSVKEAGLLADPDGTYYMTFAQYKGRNGSGFPWRLYLTLYALTGRGLALDRLSKDWPQYFRMVRRLMHERPQIVARTHNRKLGLVQRYMLVHFYQSGQRVPESEMTLENALAVGAVDIVRSILGDPNTRQKNEAAIPSLLHRLKHLTDVEAVEVCLLAIKAGAKLDFLEFDEDNTTRHKTLPLPKAHFSPLSKAIARGQPRLALTILQLHAKLNEPIPDFSFCLFEAFLSHQYQIGQILFQFYREHAADVVFECPKSWQMDCTYSMHPDLFLTRMTHFIVSHYTGLYSDLMHASNSNVCYKRALQTLLDEGADPTCSHKLGHAPLGEVLVFDDLIGLELFIQALEGKGADMLSVLEDPSNVSRLSRPERTSALIDPVDQSALCVCIRHNAIDSFRFLVQRYPGLVTEKKNVQGGTLLHRACSGFENLIPSLMKEMSDFPDHLVHLGSRVHYVEMVKILLQAGADVFAKDMFGHHPLFYALDRGDLGMADCFASFCSHEQLSQLLSRAEDGSSVYSSLFETALFYPEDILQERMAGPVEALGWVERHGGAYLHGTNNAPVWLPVLVDGIFLHHSDHFQCIELFRHLIHVFGDKLRPERCPNGRSLLHYAVSCANVELVQLLLEHGFDVNVAVDYSHNFSRHGDVSNLTTPLDEVPLIFTAQRTEMRVENWSNLDRRLLWTRAMEIATMLLERGATGILFHASLFGQIFGGDNLPQPPLNIYALRWGQYVATQLTKQMFAGGWPQPLPEDKSSSSQKGTSALKAFKVLCGLKPGIGNSPLPETTPLIETLGKLYPDSSDETVAVESSPGTHGETDRSLHDAVFMKDIDGIKSLLHSHPCRIDREDDAGKTPLEIAVELKLQGGNDSSGSSTTAASRQEIGTILRLLLEAGADPNRIPPQSLVLYQGSVPDYLSPPLHRLIRNHDIPELVEILVEAGADINTLDHWRRSPLMVAVCSDHEKTVSHLLSAGADVSQPDAFGLTVLHYAARSKDSRILERLLDHLRNHPNPPPSQLGALHIDVLGGSGLTPLLSAVFNSSVEATRLLLDRGASVTISDAGGYTPLHHAVIQGDEEIVSLLLDRGADVNTPGNCGLTPLVYAIASENKSLVASLMERGADAESVRTMMEVIEQIKLGPRNHYGLPEFVFDTDDSDGDESDGDESDGGNSD